MGYFLQAIIGNHETLLQHAPEFPSAKVVPLAENISMIPVTDDLYDEIANGGEIDRFYKLSPGIEEWATRISATSPVAYVEAEFFGGTGSQSALAWSDGSRVLGPVYAADAINQALRLLGVRAIVMDEFRAVGLDRHRNTEDWVS